MKCRRIVFILFLFSTSSLFSATYYVRPTNGNNGSAGTSHATALQDIPTAFGKISANGTATDPHYIIVEPEAIITITSTITWPAYEYVYLITGSTTDGAVDYTSTSRVTIQANAGTTYIFSCGASSDHGIIRNFNLNGNSQATSCYFESADNCAYMTFIDTRFYNATGTGMSYRGKYSTFIGCQFDSNGANGAGASQASKGESYAFLNCIFNDNTGDGLYLRYILATVSGCQFYDNGDDGLIADGYADSCRIINNTFHGQTGDNIDLAAGSINHVIIGNTFNDAGDYAIDIADNDADIFGPYLDWNHTNGNTTGITDLSGGLPGGHNQTGDPSFASTTDGSEDFQFTAGNLFENGIIGNDIGAMGANAVGSGSGTDFTAQEADDIVARIAAIHGLLDLLIGTDWEQNQLETYVTDRSSNYDATNNRYIVAVEAAYISGAWVNISSTGDLTIAVEDSDILNKILKKR